MTARGAYGLGGGTPLAPSGQPWDVAGMGVVVASVPRAWNGRGGFTGPDDIERS